MHQVALWFWFMGNNTQVSLTYVSVCGRIKAYRTNTKERLLDEHRIQTWSPWKNNSNTMSHRLLFGVFTIPHHLLRISPGKNWVPTMWKYSFPWLQSRFFVPVPQVLAHGNLKVTSYPMATPPQQVPSLKLTISHLKIEVVGVKINVMKLNHLVKVFLNIKIYCQILPDFFAGFGIFQGGLTFFILGHVWGLQKKHVPSMRFKLLFWQTKEPNHDPSGHSLPSKVGKKKLKKIIGIPRPRRTHLGYP